MTHRDSKRSGQRSRRHLAPTRMARGTPTIGVQVPVLGASSGVRCSSRGKGDQGGDPPWLLSDLRNPSLSDIRFSKKTGLVGSWNFKSTVGINIGDLEKE